MRVLVSCMYGLQSKAENPDLQGQEAIFIILSIVSEIDKTLFQLKVLRI